MKQALTFGGIASLIIILYTFIVFLAFGNFAEITFEQLATVEVLGYLRYLILFAVLIFAIRVFKKGTQPDPKYWALAKQGILTALVVAVIPVKEGKMKVVSNQNRTETGNVLPPSR